MWEWLTTLDHETFTMVLLIWAAICVVSTWSIHYTGIMPMSSREGHPGLGFLGSVDKRLGWIILETPVLVVITVFYLAGDNPLNVSVVFVIAFLCHYFNRALIFPWRIKVQGKRMPVVIMLSAMIFYIVNGYLLGHYFGALRVYPLEWLWDPRFVLGLLVFITGMVINIRSDNILINLRAPGETGYKIPRGGAFRWVTSANYFGEIVEWIGFAIMSWSLVGTVFAVWIALPLIAQAREAHRWYRSHFGAEYPAERRAILPFLL